MSIREERLHILGMIESGQISAEQGIALIQALEASEAAPALEEETSSPADATGEPPLVSSSPEVTSPAPPPPAEEVFSPQPEDPQPQPAASPASPAMQKFRHFWLIPLWIGIAITVGGAGLMYTAYRASGIGFWFACMWFPFLFGVFVLALAWATRNAPWLHVRVHQKPGESPQNIAISFPLPLRLSAWFLRIFRGRIPHMENTNLDEIVMGLENITPDHPFSVEVDEGDGERVEIYIG